MSLHAQNVECGAAYTHPFLRTLLPTTYNTPTIIQQKRTEHLTLSVGLVVQEMLSYMEQAVNMHSGSKNDVQAETATGESLTVVCQIMLP